VEWRIFTHSDFIDGQRVEIIRAISMATLLCASSVDAPRCGVQMQSSRCTSGWVGDGGSCHRRDAHPRICRFPSMQQSIFIDDAPAAQLMTRTNFSSWRRLESQQMRGVFGFGVCT
jgi:hypothetical protein